MCGPVWDFINQNRQHLEHESDFEPNKVYPSRRSWERLDMCLVTGNVITEGEMNPLMYNLANSFVGFEAAVALNDFVANYSKVVTISDVLDKGKTIDVDLNQHCALIDKMGASDRFKNALNERELLNLANYFMALPSEPAMKLWTIIGQANQANAISCHSTKDKDDRAVGNYLVEILTGDKV